MNPGEPLNSQWMEKVFEENPEIKHVMESIHPLTRAICFARHFLPETRLVAHEEIFQLIIQHLRIIGFSDTLKAFRGELTDDIPSPPFQNFSQLHFLAQRALYRVDRLYELSLSSIHSPEYMQNARTKLIDEILGSNFQYHNVQEGNTSDQEIFIEKGIITGISLNKMLMIAVSDSDPNKKEFSAILTTCWFMLTSSSEIVEKMTSKLASCADPQPIIDFLNEWINLNYNIIEPYIIKNCKLLISKYEKPHYFTHKTENKLTYLKLEIGDCTDIWKYNIESPGGPKFDLDTLPEVEFARQLTIWIVKRLQKITTIEIYEFACDRKANAPHYLNLIDHSNTLRNWIWLNLAIQSTPEKRKDKIRYFINLLKQLESMQNSFHAHVVASAVLEISANPGKQDRNVIISEDDKKLLERFESLGEPKNLNNYENELKKDQPHIIFVSGVTKKIFLAVEKFKENHVEKKYLINVEKYRLISKALLSFTSSLKIKYPFLAIKQVQLKISSLKFIEDSEIRHQMELNQFSN